MSEEASEPSMTGYRMHVFVCAHVRTPESSRGCCSEKNSLELMTRLKRAAKHAGLFDVRVQKSGCLDKCEAGPSCVVYPEGFWYTLSEESLDEILQEHLIDGRPVERFRMRIDE